MAPHVCVVILNFNGLEWLEKCCSSVLETDYDNLHTILVDNASTDGSVEFVRNRFPQIEVISSVTNAGFSEGNNAGIRRSLERNADYVVLLNPDTRVEPAWLRGLIGVGESEDRVGILGAVQLEYQSDALNSWTTTAFPGFLDELRSPDTARPLIEVDWVEGACIAIKRNVFEEIGLLDTIYFAFYEEIDFCRRAQRRGWMVALVPQSRIHHRRGGMWEANPELKRRRDYTCDRSQFIYMITSPDRSLAGNLKGYAITFATKAKEAMKGTSNGRIWDLVRMQFEVLGNAGALREKWKRDSALSPMK